MHESDPRIDEYTLAAFLAGTLTPEEREEVIAHLAASPDAREVLQMAAEALDAAETELPVEAAVSVPSTPRPRRESRAAQPRARPLRRHGVRRYAAATVIVFAIGMALRLTLGPATDALRSPVERSGAEWRVEVSAPGPSLAWPAVGNAYQYRLVVWDPLEAHVVGEFEVTENELGDSHPVVQQLRAELASERSYILRVDAIDAQNRLLRSSDTVELTLR